jgi:hypothetical protein
MSKFNDRGIGMTALSPGVSDEIDKRNRSFLPPEVHRDLSPMTEVVSYDSEVHLRGFPFKQLESAQADFGDTSLRL